MAAGKNEIIELFAKHVSPGKVNTYKKYDMLFVPGKRKGIFISDIDGKRFINCHCNGGVFNLGHRNRRVMSALRRAMARYDMGNHHLISGPRAVLAGELAATMPSGLNQVVYGVGGGEAIDLAIKLARGVTGRPGVVSARGGYHGHTGFALAAGDPKFKKKFAPMPPGFTQVPFNTIPALRKAVSKKTAAVIFETIPATLGVAVPGEDFFREAKHICEKAGALLIIDEVQTGFGRTGRFWGFENYGVSPDIVVMGKGMSGGIYPISATVFNERYAGFFREDPFVHISTCGGSELGCHAALEVVRITREAAFLEHVREMAAFFTKGLSSLAERYPAAGMRVRGLGLMMGLEFRDEINSLFMVKLLYDRGIFVVYSGNDPRVIQFLPPLIITEKEAAMVLHGVDESLKALTSGGRG